VISATVTRSLAKDSRVDKVRKTLRLPFWLRRRLKGFLGLFFDVYAQKSYSQEGEDMILRRIFEAQRVGFYVDVGAHHPRRFSNTNFFYRRGWRGINIEPNPEAAGEFRAIRSRDINIELGVSNRPGSLRYYLFDEPALNTFDEKIVESRLTGTPFKLVGTVDVAVETLGSILARHLPAGQNIDFLSVDVEGLDLAVLQSNDWARFRPYCVLVEALGVPLQHIEESEVFRFMTDLRYELIAKTFNTLFFCARR
jgi:FkbM family methyltransferase